MVLDRWCDEGEVIRVMRLTARRRDIRELGTEAKKNKGEDQTGRLRAIGERHTGTLFC